VKIRVAQGARDCGHLVANVLCEELRCRAPALLAWTAHDVLRGTAGGMQHSAWAYADVIEAMDYLARFNKKRACLARAYSAR